MRRHSTCRAAAACLLLAVLAGPTWAASFRGLGDLSGDVFFSRVRNISADGLTVVGWSKSTSGEEAFLWTQESGMLGLDDLAGGSFNSWASDASADGSVVIGQGTSEASSPGHEAFRWTDATGMIGLGHLPDGDFESHASGVSADGSIVVGDSIGADGQEAFRWVLTDPVTGDGVMAGLGDLSGGNFWSEARGTSSNGSVVVGYSQSGQGREAFWWTANTGMVGLDDLPGGAFDSFAYKTSADGSIAVGASISDQGREAFRWVLADSDTGDGVMAGLGDLSGGDYKSVAIDVSADGSVVVGYSESSAGQEAFIWDETHGMRDLRRVLIDDYGLALDDWTLIEGGGISGDGSVIAGYGINPDGNTEAWVATGVPEPATLSVLALGGCLPLFRRKRRQGLGLLRWRK